MSRVDTHVAAVQRKLTLAIFIEWSAICIFVLGILAMLMIILERTILHVPFQKPSIWIGAGVLVAAVVSLLMALLNKPSREAAAVAIDEKLGLKEKFSTALVSRASSDPFAQAVVRDAEYTADKVRLQGQFPLAYPKFANWTLVAIVLAVSALLIPPMDLFGRKKAAQRKLEQQAEIARTEQVLKDTLFKLEAMPAAAQNAEEIKILKRDLKETLENHQIPSPEKAARIQMDALSKATEELKKQADAAKEAIQQQKSYTEFNRNLQPPIDAKGPVADAQREIVKGKYEEALKDLEQVSKEFEKMNKEEQKEAEKQMEQMAQQLQKMAQDPRIQQQMQQQMKQAGLNQQQIQQMQQNMQQAANGNQQAAQQLQQQMQQAMQGMNQQQQQQVQQAVQQAQQAMQQQANAGGMGQAAQQMAQAMQQMQKAGAQGQQGQQQGGQQGQQGQGQQQAQQQMQNAQQQMQQAMAGLQQMQQQNQQAAQAGQNAQQQMQQMQQAMAQAGGQCNNPGQGQGNNPGQGQGAWKAGDPPQNQQGGGMGGPGIGNGGQGQKTPAPFAMKTEVDPSEIQKDKAFLAKVEVKDRSIRGQAKLTLEDKIKESKASEGDEVDDTRADRRAQDVQRRYFQVMQDDAKK
jgi:hypothetical protein